MRKKQNITKEEAIIQLQSQPLAANLWLLASDRLKDNAIRFPDPSYIDSQSWPDYMQKKEKSGLQISNFTEMKVPVREESSLVRQNEDIEIASNLNEPQNSIHENTSFELIVVEEFNEIIEIVESIVPDENNKLPSKRKSKKHTKDLNEHAISKEVIKEDRKVASMASEKLDFYEWLEELRETNEPAVDKAKIKKVKAKLSKEAIEIDAAKTAAENSLKLGEEIVSETLARLLARQGHKEEAIEMYQKLIIKYPEKGATFAAALQKLKS